MGISEIVTPAKLRFNRNHPRQVHKKRTDVSLGKNFDT